jgi:tryptophan synthase alpha chain
MNRIDTTFERLRANGQKALIPYLMAGDPSLQDTEELVLALEKAGADAIELGVPFSDPIADGPVIQKAAERALSAGASLKRILATVSALRKRTQIPLVLMAYYNSIQAFGEDAFCRAACEAGVDGVIVPDMPPEEADQLCAAAHSLGLRYIELLVSAFDPVKQRQALEARFLPCAYFPAMKVTSGGRRMDYLVFSRSFEKLDFTQISLEGTRRRYLQAFVKCWYGMLVAHAPSFEAADKLF